MDRITYEEIISTLAKCGRPDLIQEFKEFVSVDEDYSPSADAKKERLRKEVYSEDEGSADEEDLTFSIDEDGFHQLA
tara:strand:+ start:391 stop:621 length:231 start_codon:yes stop_codon:yes gene_type:complete